MFWVALIIAALIVYALYSWAENSDAKDEAARNEEREREKAEQAYQMEQNKRLQPAKVTRISNSDYKHDYDVPNPPGPVRVTDSEQPDDGAVVLFGNTRRIIYVYDDRPLKDVPKNKAIFLTVCGRDITMRSITTGTVWDSAENGDIPVSYKGKPIGFVSFDKVPGLKDAASRHLIQIRAVWPGGIISGVKHLVVLAPTSASMAETIAELD